MIPPTTNPWNTVKQGTRPLRPTSGLYPPLRHSLQRPQPHCPTRTHLLQVHLQKQQQQASTRSTYIPSLISLALWILPEIKTRIVAKIKFWILPAAFTLRRHSEDLDEKLAAGGQVWYERRGLVVDDERENSDGRGGDGGPVAIMLSLPAVGAIAAAAAALGF